MNEPWRPSMPIAIVLGVLAPGAGLLYAGRPIFAVIAAALYWAVTVGAPALVVDVSPTRIIPITATATIAVIIVSALAGGLVAGLTQRGARKPWQHLWWVAGFGLLCQVGASQLRTRVVGEHIASFAMIEQTRYVIVKRAPRAGEQVAVKQGNEIVLRAAPVDATAVDVIGPAIPLR